MSNPTNNKAERPTMPAVLKGWKRKCPQCGSGPLLSGYLTVNDTCTVCSEELHHHRADDGPAYLTILLVGHLMAPLLHMIFVRYRPEPLALFYNICCWLCWIIALSSPSTQGRNDRLSMGTFDARIPITYRALRIWGK
jgi:uncharacterized protein (DUF983 family)